MATAAAESVSAPGELAAFLRGHSRSLVLEGAGCSVASGIPEYRDHDGSWKSRPPVRYAEFVASEAVRQRYWARSLFGWTRVAAAVPNAGHRDLARLEHAGRGHGRDAERRRAPSARGESAA